MEGIPEGRAIKTKGMDGGFQGLERNPPVCLEHRVCIRKNWGTGLQK